MTAGTTAAAPGGATLPAAPLAGQDGQQVGPHECENGDGNRFRYVLTDVDASETQLLCASCAMALFVAVVQQLAADGALPAGDNDGGGA
jgi:hypothetical protein